MTSWFRAILIAQLILLVCVGYLRLWYLSKLSEQGAEEWVYGAFLFCTSIPSIFIPFIIGKSIDAGKFSTILGRVTIATLLFGLLTLLIFPYVSLIVLACSFSFIASIAVVSGQLCSKSAVTHCLDSREITKGNVLIQAMLAISMLAPALLFLYTPHLYSNYTIVWLLILGASISLGLQKKFIHNIPTSLPTGNFVGPTESFRILRNLFTIRGCSAFMLLLFFMQFLAGIAEGYLLPVVEQRLGAKGLVYSMVGMGLLYALGSLLSDFLHREPKFSFSPIDIFLVLCAGSSIFANTDDVFLRVSVIMLFILLNPHIYVITDSFIQRRVHRNQIGSNLSVLRVASFVCLSFGNLIVSLHYVF